MTPPDPITLAPAEGPALQWAREMVAARHYLRTVPDPRTRPLCYVAWLGSEPVGCLFFGRAESTRCFAGELTYGSAGDVAAGRARFDRWEVLNLSRVWLVPDVQPGGRFHGPAHLPGFIDRRGNFRSVLASELIRRALARVGTDYLIARPPVFVDQPYQVRAVLSYCDTRLHRGTIYRAAGFRLARVNGKGIETWWTAGVAPPTPEQDAAIREASARSARARRIRNRAVSLFE